MPSVLITRPQAAAEFMAQELQDCGYAGVIEPMLDIIATDVPQPDAKELTDIQALMITSANALTTLGKGGYELNDLLSFPCFCVGPKTAEKATKLGFRRVHHSDGDGAALAQLINQTLPQKKKAILHVAGQHTDSKAKDGLQELGFKVIAWPIYRAVPATKFSPHTLQLLKQGKVDAVTLFSVRTGETFVALLKQHKLEACCNGLIAIGLSHADSDTLKSLQWRQLLTASTPTEEAVLDCLTEILPVS